MPTPTIPAGNLYFNATLWTGNYPSTQTITNGVAGQSFAPDFVWIKGRSYADGHTLWNTITGAQYSLSSNTTTAETNRPLALTAFTSTGFTLGADSLVNPGSGNTVVGWQWKAGGTAVSNTDGTITSSVSANQTSGFSVVTYTGNGANGATVGHGLSVLGVTPAMIITKVRGTTGNWWVWQAAMGDNVVQLNTTIAQVPSTGNGVYNTAGINSTVFALGAGSINGNGSTFVSYCWTPIAGYSAFGSYTGNGSTDGTFVYLGFRPRFIMIKRSSGVGDWLIQDTSRSPYNLSDSVLYPNYTDAEGTGGGYGIDILSNGFKFRNSATYANSSGSTYVYACWAENPFKYSNAR
jgi:hypothetical protein